MENILIGTTNPSKIEFFESLLADYPLHLLTPADLSIQASPEENGKTPLENALIKARFYAGYHPFVFTTDSGLVFDSLAPDDSRQPGLSIRSPYGRRLSDEEMLAYYAGLVRGLGGSVVAYYKDAFALIIGNETYTFESRREELYQSAFILNDTPVKARRPGWPLDSISCFRDGRSFLDAEDRTYQNSAQQQWGYLPRLRQFVCETIGSILFAGDLS